MVRLPSIITVFAVFIILSLAANAEDNPFEIERMVIAAGVEEREPVEVADSFAAGIERVYCFLEAQNIQQDTEVTFVWYHGEERAASVTVALGQGPRWRTFSYVTIRDRTGEWRVDLHDAMDNIVQSVNFRIR